MGVGSKSCCESCKSAPATLFCSADSAFLCTNCDSNIHAANKLASRHPRVWICDVCEKSPASVTCKADAASLCSACDHDIHSANPLARRHQRFPVVPFYDCQGGERNEGDGCFSDREQELEVEAEAASWLLPNPNNPPPPAALPTPEVNVNENKKNSYIYRDENDEKGGENYNYLNGDGVVPVQGYQTQSTPPVVDGFPAYDLDYCGPLMYNFTSQSISQSVSSSSSMEVGLVPDHNNIADVSNSITQNPNSESLIPNPLTGLDREARVLRYREKRKNRKFEKTIRYASRKAYAETRPRIKGRFAKRSEIEDVDALVSPDAAAAAAAYGVVPSYY